MRLLSHMGIVWENGSLFEVNAELEARFGRELSEEYTEVIGTQQTALFSGQLVSDESRARVCGFQQRISGLLIKQSKTLQRFRLRWIECVL